VYAVTATVTVDSAAGAAVEAQLAANLADADAIATALTLPAGSVSGATAPTTTTMTAGAPPPSPPPPRPPLPLNPGETQEISVTYGFHTTDSAFDATAAEEAIAGKLGINKADVVVTKTGPDAAGKYTVTVSIYAGDPTAATDMANVLNSMGASDLATALDALAGSVSSVMAAEAVIVTVAPPPPPSSVLPTPSPPPPSPSPPSPSPPPSPPWMPPGQMAVATHQFTLKAADTATRRRRLAEMTPDLVKAELIALLQLEGLSLGGDGALISVEVTLTAQVVKVAPLFDRTFAVTIVARAEHSDALAKHINDADFKSTLAGPAHLSTTVVFEDIKAVEYSSVVTAPPKGGTTPPKPKDKGALATLGESNVSSEVNEDGYWAFLPVGLLMFPLVIYIYTRYRYGAGKTCKWLRYKCSHSNPVTPFLYLPKDVKERMHSELHSTEV
jgi:hypothetical protein